MELNNLVDKQVNVANQLQDYLLRWVAEAKKYSAKKQKVQLTPTEKEKLQGLGYIQQITLLSSQGIDDEIKNKNTTFTNACSYNQYVLKDICQSY